MKQKRDDNEVTHINKTPTKQTAGVRAKPPSPIKPELFFAPFKELVGKIYQISKDQQGCRFLQKKLEEQKPEEVDQIFEEVFEHITELMTGLKKKKKLFCSSSISPLIELCNPDPFGNYLCQKLLEFCNDEQKYQIVKRVSPDLVEIAKNMHGTRAVQKMIECLSSPPQVRKDTEFLFF